MKPKLEQTNNEKNELRPLFRIAIDIHSEWKNVNYSAMPYLSALHQLNSISDTYIYDSASDIILHFLSNASTFRGKVARELKNELKQHLLAGKKS